MNFMFFGYVKIKFVIFALLTILIWRPCQHINLKSNVLRYDFYLKLDPIFSNKIPQQTPFISRLTLIRLGFLKVVFPRGGRGGGGGGGQFDPLPVVFRKMYLLKRG